MAGSIVVQRLFSCQRGHAVPQEYVELRRMAGMNWFGCPCGERVSLMEPRQLMEAKREVPRMDSEVDRERDRRARDLTMRGKEVLGEYDVFLCHNSRDRDAVLQIAQGLKEKKIRSWLDIAALRPGDVWLDVIAQIIAKVKCAVVFIGPS